MMLPDDGFPGSGSFSPTDKVSFPPFLPFPPSFSPSLPHLIRLPQKFFFSHAPLFPRYPHPSDGSAPSPPPLPLPPTLSVLCSALVGSSEPNKGILFRFSEPNRTEMFCSATSLSPSTLALLSQTREFYSALLSQTEQKSSVRPLVAEQKKAVRPTKTEHV